MVGGAEALLGCPARVRTLGSISQVTDGKGCWKVGFPGIAVGLFAKVRQDWFRGVLGTEGSGFCQPNIFFFFFFSLINSISPQLLH